MLEEREGKTGVREGRRKAGEEKREGKGEGRLEEREAGVE